MEPKDPRERGAPPSDGVPDQTRRPHGDAAHWRHRTAGPRERGSAMTAIDKTVRGLRCFASDVAQGFFEITHNGMALVGLATVCLVLTIATRPDLREVGEVR